MNLCVFCQPKLGALKINTRPVISETSAPANMVQFIDMRPVPASSPSATPVDTPVNPLWLEMSHCQVSQTPKSASHSNSFVDLNPSPLPALDYLAEYLLDIVESNCNKVFKGRLI